MKLKSNVALGRAIAAGRMLAGLDQVQLADLAGVAPSTVSNVERGRANSREETVEAIKQGLLRKGVDLTLNSRTGHYGAGTSYP